MDHIANYDTKWDNYCKKLLQRIRTSGNDFPDEDEINQLVKVTEQAFGESPYIQHAMDRIFDIRRQWKTKNHNRIMEKRRRKQRNTQEPGMENIETQPTVKKEIAEPIKESIEKVITKIAQENNIRYADKVVIKLSENEGIITFKGMEE